MNVADEPFDHQDLRDAAGALSSAVASDVPPDASMLLNAVGVMHKAWYAFEAQKHQIHHLTKGWKGYPEGEAYSEPGSLAATLRAVGQNQGATYLMVAADRLDALEAEVNK